MSDTNELRAVKLTKAQERALRSAVHGLLTIDPKGYLAFDGSDGSRHHWTPVHVCVKNGWLRKLSRKVPYCVGERVELTEAGRALLSTSDARAPSVEEGKHG